ncbi:MAG: aldo/keto reductase, partial [Bacteroidales bacterium]|nr:aldo/keto reductase [Bacteroidales bacterium]
MDRRQFIRTTGLAAAAAGLAACAPKAPAVGAEPRELKTNGTMLQNFPGIGVLGYGCMRWPMTKDENGVEHIDQQKVNDMVDKALANGVNYFDTSPVYLRGDSERATAEALNRHPRESWLLATKLSNFSDASYDNSVLMYRNSLKVFKTDHIDYYLLHSIGSADDFKSRFEDTGILDFLLKEREAGRIRYLGFSIHSQQPGFDAMMEKHPKYHWDFVQIQMNYLDWTHAGGRNTNAKYL